MSAEAVPTGGSRESRQVEGKAFARRFCNLLCELQLQPGIYRRIERIVQDFGIERPALRAVYISRYVDPTYFSEEAYGAEAAAHPQLQALVIEGRNLYEFLAFAQGFRCHTTPISTIVNIEETWLEPEPSQPFLFRACLYHSFPAATILYAPDGDLQEYAMQFLDSLKNVRGF